MNRNIKDILYFRTDISPFLVHLTKDYGNNTACENLKSIIVEKKLKCGKTLVSRARFGMNTTSMSQSDKESFFSAICFTETPLNEIHCLLNIGGRRTDLQPYGLLFIKEKLQKKGVSPVIYINNENGDKYSLFSALCGLIQNNRNEAKQILPLISVFGKTINPPRRTTSPVSKMDFTWEREWRFPKISGDLSFRKTDVFIGLCPHREIPFFESQWDGVGFVDPTKNLKWYAKKLIAARQKFDLKYSVV